MGVEPLACSSGSVTAADVVGSSTLSIQRKISGMLPWAGSLLAAVGVTPGAAVVTPTRSTCDTPVSNHEPYVDSVVFDVIRQPPGYDVALWLPLVTRFGMVTLLTPAVGL